MYFITILFDVHCYDFVSNLENNKLNVTIFESKWKCLILYKS